MSEINQTGKMATTTVRAPLFKINRAQLPLYCPRPEMGLWDQHPRVYLPIETSGREKCPYCGNEFLLEE